MSRWRRDFLRKRPHPELQQQMTEPRAMLLTNCHRLYPLYPLVIGLLCPWMWTNKHFLCRSKICRKDEEHGRSDSNYEFNYHKSRKIGAGASAISLIIPYVDMNRGYSTNYHKSSPRILKVKWILRQSADEYPNTKALLAVREDI